MDFSVKKKIEVLTKRSQQVRNNKENQGKDFPDKKSKFDERTSIKKLGTCLHELFIIIIIEHSA